MMSMKDLEEFAINTGQRPSPSNPNPKEDRGPLDLTLLIEQSDKKIKELKDVIDGHKSWHDSDKQQIWDLKKILGEKRSVEQTNEDLKAKLTEVMKDNIRLTKQTDEYVQRLRDKGVF
jgi:hypothetical protein